MATTSSASTRPSNVRRLLIEIAVVVVVALIGFVAWWWCARQSDARVAEVQAQSDARIAAAAESAELWASSLAARQAETVLRAFAAGLYPQLLVSDTGGEGFDIAIGALLELPGVDFVHILGPDGSVLASSDRKFMVAGAVGDRADWALGTTQLASRRGNLPGTIELATPILSTEGVEAIAWLGYNTEGVRESSRPEALVVNTEPVERVEETPPAEGEAGD
jgi:hypothetical protein